VLFILHRQIGNQWADIANILAGRTDNTIKNHWNSSMRKLISNFEKEFDAQCRKHFQENKLDYFGTKKEVSRSQPQSYHKNIKEVEDRILQKSLESVR